MILKFAGFLSAAAEADADIVALTVADIDDDMVLMNSHWKRDNEG